MDSTTILQFACVAAFTAIAMATDLRTRRIPNWLTVTAAISGLAFHCLVSTREGLLFSLGGFAVGFGILFVLWIIGGGGGGDVKLMGAIGAWLGPRYTLGVFLLSVVFAMACIACVMAYGILNNANKQNESTNLLKKTIPYALPCGLSTWSILLLRVVTQN